MSNITPGPWGLRGVQIRADNGNGKHVATYQICEDDGRLIAAAPELLDMLFLACDRLDASANISDDIRKRIGELLRNKHISEE